MTAQAIMDELKASGYDLYLDGENIGFRHAGVAIAPREKVLPLIKALKQHKGEAISLLRVERKTCCDISPLPYFASDGSLVIPFGSDPRYHYWRDGQSVGR
jgi:hypothetical protein